MKPAEKETESARQAGFWRRVWDLYADGFRSMTIGRKLWALIAIKLVIIFLVLKIFFFPDFLASKSDTDSGKATLVRENLTKTNAAYLEPNPASNAPCQEVNPDYKVPNQEDNPASEVPDL